MNIEHIHLDTIDSTQSYLKSLLNDDNYLGRDLLISTSQQDAGVGRKGNSWLHLPDALAFSFTLKPSNTLTLTPLEIGVHLAKYFEPYIKLKWPNDLLSLKGEKIGGIICQYYKETILVGIGINLKYDSKYDHEFPYPVSGISNDLELSDDFKESMPFDIYRSVLTNRYNDLDLANEWNSLCAHHDTAVTITDTDVSHTGLFKGLGKNGEALLLKSDSTIEKVLTGTLRIN